LSLCGAYINLPLPAASFPKENIMIRALRHSLVALLLFTAPAFAAETYTLDTNHTNVVWTINHFGFSNPSGKITKVEGTLTLDEADPTKSQVIVKMSAANLDTGIEKLDEHLKGKDFFDVAQYHDITFTSDTVELTGKDTANVTGILKLHGIAKPVTLQVKLNKIGNNMMNKKTAGFSATTMVKRSDFGMTTYLPMLGDAVGISIESEANIQ
jgi:polyisoprenoid-binding protein YceI